MSRFNDTMIFFKFTDYVCISPTGGRGRSLSDPSRKVCIHYIDQIEKVIEPEKEIDDKIKPQKGW